MKHGHKEIYPQNRVNFIVALCTGVFVTFLLADGAENWLFRLFWLG